jgi:hypothetical protein
MKSKARKWTPQIVSPWLTRAEAGDYLRWSVRTVDRHLVSMGKIRVPGKIRFELQETGTVNKVRILAEDVYALCPLPDPIAA